MDFTNKKVTIIGLSESGFSAAKLLAKAKANVRISEARDESDVRDKLCLLSGVEFELGRHTKDFIDASDLIVVSPGVSLHAEPLKWAADKNIPVIGELELGYMFCPAPIIAVTGTNGKSTTVSLLHEILKANGIKSNLLGNIGRPFTEDVLDVSPDSAVSLEVSSFQLEAIDRFRPTIAVFLNFTQDHLDRYKNMAEYKNAKLRIFENQTKDDCAVLNHDDPGTISLSSALKSKIYYFSVRQKVKGCYPEGNRLLVDLGDGPSELCKISDMSLSGIHNLENVLAAALAAKVFDGKSEVISALRDFKGLPHRFELIAEVNGVKFIDDSKSTTVDSTVRALESISGNSVILIAGGRDKASDYSPLLAQAEKLKCAVLIGEARKKIKNCLTMRDVIVKESVTLEDAVLLSRRIARMGDIVLLSPMCSSFDMFRDYKERGEAFRAAVLKSPQSTVHSPQKESIVSNSQDIL